MFPTMRPANINSQDKSWATIPLASVVKDDTVDHNGYVTRVRLVMSKGLDVALDTQFGRLVGPPTQMVDVLR